jgi:hypothetical protein
MRRLVLAFAMMLLVAAAVSVALASTGASSGLRGRVLYGPTCPVERPGESCTRPYRTWASARSSGAADVSSEASAREILDRRLATGELTLEQYKELRAAIEGEVPRASREPLPSRPASVPG